MFSFLYSSLRLPKLSRRAWITLKELNRYTQKVIWITQCKNHEIALNMLTNRIRRLIKKSGFNFTFLYLKEVMRLTIRSLAGNPEPKYLPKGVMVKRDHTGLPTIVPSTLRKILLDFKNNQKVVVCILSILSMYRVFPTKAVPKLDTIIDPFSGTVRTLSSKSIRTVLREITRGIQIRHPQLLKKESAGPNAKKLTWGSGIDAIAFIDHPKVWVSYLNYCLIVKCYWPIIWLTLLIVVSSPLVIGLKTGRWLKKLNMGRLSVVYDQAGKARIVAITNWWIQLILSPLHDAIFDILRKLNQDGTFDQQKPLDNLIAKGITGHKFSSFDLSAATDRIPIDIQRDILNILYPKLGSAWANLLAFGWYYEGQEYKYSVGQPMGALSSWAMLALTHHILVRIAALRVGMRNFEDYAILGDDIVIYNDKVAKSYYNLLTSLGVSINLSKSVESYDFAEFAKVWKGPGVNITPIGPGLTLRFVRDRSYAGTYLREAHKLGLFNHFAEVLARIEDIGKDRNTRSQVFNSLWSSFGISGFMQGERSIDANAIMLCFSSTVNPVPVLRYHYFDALVHSLFDDIREALRKLLDNKRFFYRNWWRVWCTKGWSLRLLEAFLKLLAPGFWVYLISFWKEELSLERHYRYSKKITLLLLNGNRVYQSWDWLDLLVSDSLIGSSSIDWTQKKLIKEQSKKVKLISKRLAEFQKEDKVYKAPIKANVTLKLF